MTHLNIQQGLNIEVVSTNLIKKLYEAALSVPEPLEGELDAAYMSGNLLVDKSYRALVEYLTNRFDDLHINVTNSYYIDFEDPEVASVLLGTVSTDGIGVSEGDATLITSFNTLGLTNNSSIISFDELKYFTNITSIPQGALDGTDNITKINLKNISTLGQSSLSWKTQLSNVGLTTNLRTVGKFAFMNDSSLQNIDLTGVTTIELEAFRGTGITDVNCPNLLNLNGSGNFQMSSVQTITDLGSVTILPDSAFWKCTSLTSADISNIVTIKSSVFSGCSSLNNIDLSDVTSIGLNGFRECTHLAMALNLPNLTSLGQYAFYNTGITSITDLGNVTNIPEYCFHNCGSLTTVTLPSTCTGIGVGAFAGDNYLTTVTGMSQLTSIGNYAFQDCPITGTLNLPNLTGALGVYAFANTHISSISSLGSVTDIQERAFLNTDISSITIPNSVKKCSCSLVSDTNVPEIIFPEGVEEIHGGLFLTKNNSLTYIEIPSTVTNMSIFFHRTLEYSQNDLCTLVIKATTPPALNYYSVWEADTTRGDKFAGIYVPDASLTAYQNGANAWLHSSIQAKLKPISQLLTDNPTAWAKYNRTSTV